MFKRNYSYKFELNHYWEFKYFIAIIWKHNPQHKLFFMQSIQPSTFFSSNFLSTIFGCVFEYI